MKESNPLPTPGGHHRFHLLDALRGLVSVLVVYLHAPAYLNLRAGHDTTLGVDFFFCLSGFVIAFSYERRLALSLTFKQFLRARLIRLYPIYLFGLLEGTISFLLVMVKFPLSIGDVGRLSILFGLQTLILPGFGVWKSHLLFPLNFPAWSMFFELLVNIAFAAAIRKKIASNKALIATYAVSLALMIGLTTQYKGTDVGWGLNAGHLIGGTARVCLSFVAGVLILRYTRANPRKSFSDRISIFASLGIIIALLLILQSPHPVLRTKLFQLLAISSLLPATVYLGSRCHVSKRLAPVCAFLGDISFPLYLIHAPIMVLFDLPAVKALLLRLPSLQPLVVPSVLLIAGTISYFVMTYYDLPVRAFLRRQQSLRSLIFHLPTALTRQGSVSDRSEQGLGQRYRDEAAKHVAML
ncbi:putative acyltransferase [Terriglobus roseus DSM 18391]|uniref:Putative acyltransferase n=1 Tax=Terriglobus roseus (strain DSM 18391 / NRRL B-41598 / KBS 63) TaxID=926566 RepID=I3ZI34_TERRK|nr:acyltransferase [Terriglobus roseus]AFL88561.1 putative acyltransferase [Terriglobus roseus DSM 18391]AFL88902.1 putative acyltransferase [Terriglobus roseus DSM 18391]